MRDWMRWMAGLGVVAGLLAAEGEAGAADPVATASSLIVREIAYEGRLTPDEARFAVELEAESSGPGESSITLFEGDVAVMPTRLPKGIRLARDGSAYRLLVSRPGLHRLSFEMLARIQRGEPWNQVEFVGPEAGVARVRADAEGRAVELRLMSGIAREPDAANPSSVRGVLGSDRRVALRWQDRSVESVRPPLVTCETTGQVQVGPGVARYTSRFNYTVVQGHLSALTIRLPQGQTLTRVEGRQIRDWRLEGSETSQRLSVEFIKPVEGDYELTIQTEQVVSRQGQLEVELPEPDGIDRESGTLVLLAEDSVLRVDSLDGFRQVETPDRAVAAYRFHARPAHLQLQASRLEAQVSISSRIRAAIEDRRLLLRHGIDLNVESGGLYAIEFILPEDCSVSDVRSEGLERWAVREGRLLAEFASRVVGPRRLEVLLEQTFARVADRVSLRPLKPVAPARQVVQIGVAPAPGLRVRTLELSGLRELPVNLLQNRTDEGLAYQSDQEDWRLTLSTERLEPRILAEVFNLVTIGDGLLGGSATVRYVILNQGVQEFHVRIPSHWRNVEFTGPNIRRAERVREADGARDALWAIRLQDRAWGGYTLVVTYDEPFDLHRASLSIGGLRVVGVERETGTIAITGAANLQLSPGEISGPLHRIDDSELAAADRAILTRSVLLAYRYHAGGDYRLRLETTRFQELPVLDAVADRTQLTTVITGAGEMLTQAMFMVKNNDKQFQRFTLPEGARFWSAFVNGQPAKAEVDGEALLVPLPRIADRDQSFAVEIVYAQNGVAMGAGLPGKIALSAPRTDVQTTFAEWELFVPGTHELGGFGGNMSVARGTTYGLRDAWEEFVDAYRNLWRSTRGFLVVLAVAGVIGGLVVTAVRRGWHGALGALAGVVIIAVLAGMLLPSLAKSKAKAQRISAINSLKQLGLAARIYATDNKGRLPADLDQLSRQLSGGKHAVDPESGDRFVYLGQGRDDLDASAVLAYSPKSTGSRAVLFADGSVQQMSEAGFNEALQRTLRPVMGQAAPAQNPASIPAPGGPVAGTGLALLSGTPGKEPVIRGVRPIRVEVPRAGQRFTFTKVLNVREEPLTIDAWAVATRTLNHARSGIQISVFVLGLALLAIELRRPRPRPPWVAAAFSAMILSTGHWLITLRLLGMALIVAVPLVVFACLILAARARFARSIANPGSDEAGAAPTEGPGRSPGMGPAVAGLALLFAVSQANAGGIESGAEAGKSRSRDAVTIRSAVYSGRVMDQTASIEALLEIESGRPERAVPLFGEDVAIEEFSVVFGNARLDLPPRTCPGRASPRFGSGCWSNMRET